MQEFAQWSSFFVIVGSSAGALIGLQFVVMTLVAERPPSQALEAGAAFATPTIVHFSAVLLFSALLSAPWHSITTPAIVWGGSGIGGIVYAFIVTVRMKRQAAYEPVFEDWLFHAILPFVAYTLLAGSAFVAFGDLYHALLAVAAATLLLLFIGIHNSWDGVTYFIHIRSQKRTTEDKGRESISDSSKRMSENQN